MHDHKRAAGPQASFPIIPCALSVLLLRRGQVLAHVLGRELLHKKHVLVTAAVGVDFLNFTPL